MYDVVETNRLITPELAVSMLQSLDHEIEYRGESLPSGLDCSLEIAGKNIAIFVSGEPAPPEHPIVEVVANYRKSILKAAKKLTSSDTAKVVFTGRWHDAEMEMDPMFIGYLVHVVDIKGYVATGRYELEVFDWDDSPNGRPIYLTLPRGGGEDRLYWLRVTAEHHLKLDEAMRASSGQHMLDGMIFFPTSGDGRAPIVVVNCVGLNAFTNERLVKEGDQHFVKTLSGYDHALVALRLAANESRPSLHHLNATYLSAAAFADELAKTGYTASLTKDTRQAFAGTLLGIHGGAVVQRGTDLGDLTFYDLYELGLIDEFHSYFDCNTGDLLESRMSFDDSNACRIAREHVAKPIAVGDVGRLTEGARFTSGWIEWKEKYKKLFEA